MKATVVFWNDFVLTRDFWAFKRATYEITILEEKRERELIEKINEAAGNVSKRLKQHNKLNFSGR